MAKKTLSNIHLGEILNEEFLLPMNISQSALARAAGVPPRRSMKSCSANAMSLLMRRYGWPRCSAPVKDSGLVCRRLTILRNRGMPSALIWIGLNGWLLDG